MIHYHGTPLGGLRVDVPRILHGRHAFVSFLAQEDLPVVAEVCESFAFDNGDYSAWKRGADLDLDGYLAWCEEWHTHPGFDWCVIPDVIDGDERDNNDLVSWWVSECRTRAPSLLLRSVPVFHMHESLDRLRGLMHLSLAFFDRIAIGSSGQWPQPGVSPGWDERISEIMQVVCDERGRPKVRLHGLRMLNPEIFTKYPLASADSTNVSQNHHAAREQRAVTACQRADIIAWRAEKFQSPAAWVKQEQRELFRLIGS